MKTKIGILTLAFCVSVLGLHAQRTVTTTTTARAVSYDISDNLDLDAVASIFGDCENLEDFEARLNNPENRISNLDLNEDGYVDYLRVVENSSEQNSLVVIQAVLDNNRYQDVATIEVERVQNSNPRIQIVGDSYLYGNNYIIEPVFTRTPLIFSFFWGPRYSVWHSPYHWSYYPSWYEQCRPYSPFKYLRYVYGHINRYNTYKHTSNRHNHFNDDKYQQIRRNDYASQHPERSFSKRQEGYTNKQELYEQRPSNFGRSSQNDRIQSYENNQYQNNKKSESSNKRTNERSQYQAPVSKNSYIQQNKQRNKSTEGSNSSNGSVQIKTDSNRGTSETLPITRSRTRDSEKSTNQVEQNKRSSQNEKSGSVNNSSSRTNRETRLQQRTAKKAEAKKTGNREKRRTE